MILHYFHLRNAGFADVMQPIWWRSLTEIGQVPRLIERVHVSAAESRHIDCITLGEICITQM